MQLTGRTSREPYTSKSRGSMNGKRPSGPSCAEIHALLLLSLVTDVCDGFQHRSWVWLIRLMKQKTAIRWRKSRCQDHGFEGQRLLIKGSTQIGGRIERASRKQAQWLVKIYGTSPKGGSKHGCKTGMRETGSGAGTNVSGKATRVRGKALSSCANRGR